MTLLHRFASPLACGLLLLSLSGMTEATNETFFVNITNVVGATVLDAQGQGTIGNDDADPCSGFTFPYTLSGADNSARVAELRQAIECANANAMNRAGFAGGC